MPEPRAASRNAGLGKSGDGVRLTGAQMADRTARHRQRHAFGAGSASPSSQEGRHQADRTDPPPDQRETSGL